MRIIISNTSAIIKIKPPKIKIQYVLYTSFKNLKQ